jgi:hypothetical protein
MKAWPQPASHPCDSNRPDASLSRRHFLWTAAGVLGAAGLARADEPAANPTAATAARKPAVAIAAGQSRRENICQSLVAIEDRIMPVLRTKKCVVIKPNIVNTGNQLASTHVDALHGILDFLGPRFKGPVVIAEASAGFTTEGYDHFHYHDVVAAHKPLAISLVDLNEEGKFLTHTILNGRGGNALDQEHGARRAPAQPAQGNARLERQAPLPRRRAPDPRGHHADRTASAAVLGRHRD